LCSVRGRPLHPVCCRALLSKVKLGAGQLGSLRYYSRSYMSLPLRVGRCNMA
jgi:hypothetical protein